MVSLVRSALALVLFVGLAATARAQQPTQAQIGAIRSACRGDYNNVCANVPTGGKAALQCLQQHASEVSDGCRQSLAPLSGAAAPPATAAPQSAPASTATAMPPPPHMSPRAEMRLLRTDCGADFRRFCAGVPLGGGEGLRCLSAHQAQLRPACHSALQEAAASR